MATDPDSETTSIGRAGWFLRGATNAFSVPGLILCTAFVGFGGLARENGFTLVQTVFMVSVIWALPAKVVLIGAVASGATIWGAALAVALSSVRLMPMTMSLMPELRGPSTPRWVLFALSHFVAVTSWVLGMERLRTIPRPMRTSWYAGLAIVLILINIATVIVVFAVAGDLPPELSAALLLLTPMYFLTSLWGSARERAGHLALVAGMVVGPAFHLMWPAIDLLAAGAIGGGLAYALHRMTARRA
ncbi:MAG: AzlC family ABC transporter permease [Rhizobiaceae bacterium]